MKRTVLGVILLVLVGSIARTATIPTAPQSLNLTSLQRFERVWLSQHIQHYSFTVERSCFCLPRVISASYKVSAGSSKLVSWSALRARWEFQGYVSIGKLFKAMRDTLRQGGRVSASFDSRFGFPTQITLDRVPNAIDDELYLSVSNFSH